MNKLIFHYMLANTLFRQPDGREGISERKPAGLPRQGADLSIKVMLGWGLALLVTTALYYLFIA